MVGLITNPQYKILYETKYEKLKVFYPPMETKNYTAFPIIQLTNEDKDVLVDVSDRYETVLRITSEDK